jgi:hypothetical protein
VSALPVALSFVGNNSGVKANRTLLVKLYAEFHPRRAFDVCALVEARMNTPVRIRLSIIIRRATKNIHMCV